MTQISVIMPVYNAQQFLANTIESVLQQTFTNWELICIDDGSTDNSVNIIKRYANKVKLITCDRNNGVAAARNLGIANASAELIAFIDADDQFEKNALAYQFSYFTSCNLNSPYIVIGKSKINMENDGLADQYFLNKKNGDEFYLSVLGAVLCPISIFNITGKFNQALKIGEDVDWFMNLKDNNVKILYNDTVVLNVNRHKNNLTKDAKQTTRSHLELFRDRIHRKTNG